MFRLEEATGLFPGLEDQRQFSQLRSTGADLQPVQIVPQDESRNLTRRIALLLVDLDQQIKRIGEHVAGACCGVAQADVFWRRNP